MLTQNAVSNRELLFDHQWNLEFVEPLGGHREANQTTAILRHEVDGFGSDLFRRHGEITFIFSIFVVSDDHHLACSDGRNGIFDAGERPSAGCRIYKSKLLRSMDPHLAVTSNNLSSERASWMIALTRDLYVFAPGVTAGISAILFSIDNFA
jgi:hypothetical protein